MDDNRANWRGGLLGSLKTTFVLSLLVGIGLPIFMNFERSMAWGKLFLIGLAGFIGFWIILLTGLAMVALVTRRSKGNRNP
ncbi:MAG: hypothetical protein FJ110_06090 [Deltaproteobacteria bacterium]|nr:hypothetical protein [Deltaproteobacteria bacterium]